MILLALFGAAITHAIGIHAVFGGFVAGVAVGGSTKVKQRTRMVIEDFVMNVFAPVFFASLGLRIDFAKAFDLRLCVLVFVVATLAKVIGCSIGARARRAPGIGGSRRRSASASTRVARWRSSWHYWRSTPGSFASESSSRSSSWPSARRSSAGR